MMPHGYDIYTMNRLKDTENVLHLEENPVLQQRHKKSFLIIGSALPSVNLSL